MISSGKRRREFIQSVKGWLICKERGIQKLYILVSTLHVEMVKLTGTGI
jgi:hypothetical protein